MRLCSQTLTGHCSDSGAGIIVFSGVVSACGCREDPEDHPEPQVQPGLLRYIHLSWIQEWARSNVSKENVISSRKCLSFLPGKKAHINSGQKAEVGVLRPVSPTPLKFPSVGLTAGPLVPTCLS